MKSDALRPAWVALVVCAVLMPRLLMLGAPPATDEGIYAFNTLMIHLNSPPGNLLADFGTLSLYQAMLAWVFSLDINHFVLLRALDALVAILAGLMLFQVTRYESASNMAGAVIAVIFLITMSDPIFIQYGFKNSITAASLPLLTAIAIGQRATLNNTIVWACVGGLVAIAGLLREPFAVLILAGVVVVYIRAGGRAMSAYLLGSVLTGVVILLTMIWMRGGYENLIKSYAELTIIYQEIAYQWLVLLQTNTVTFAKNAISALLLTGLAVYWIAKKPELYPRLGFWLLLAIAPLLEPLLKNGYPYHYANMLFGLAGLVAMGWRAASDRGGVRTRTVVLVFLFAGLLLLPKIGKFVRAYHQFSSQFGTQNTSIGWPKSVVQQSNYLLIAEHIHTHSKGNPTVAIHGSMLGLIPLAKAKPSSPELANLSYNYIQSNKDSNRLRAQIVACPPEFIVLTQSSPFNDTKVLSRIVKSIPEYRLSAYIPQSVQRHYGSFDGAIYQWTGTPNTCQQAKKERR